MKIPTNLALTAVLCASCNANANETDFGVELEAGMAYDSSLNVVELDRSVDTSDKGLLLKGKLDGKWQPTEKLSVQGGYSYSSTDYRQTDAYDLAIQQLFADLSYDFSTMTLGVRHTVADAALDGEDLLLLKQTSVYAARLFNQRWYLRGAVDLRDKTFEDFPERNADAQALSADVFLFFNDARSYLVLGLTHENEEAVDEQFDYRGRGVNARLANRFAWLGKDNKVELSLRYIDRDYPDSGNELTEPQREDHRISTELAWEFSLNSYLTAVSRVRYSDNKSDLASADYTETLASVSLRARF